MKEMKRILALVLCFVMLIGLAPSAEALVPKSAGTTYSGQAMRVSGSVIDAAIFCSDVHGNSNVVSSAFNGIKNADSTFNPSTATFVGDTQMAASEVTSAAQSVYSGVECYYAYGNHDSEGNYGISDVTGMLYSGENYYIYAISQTSMASSNPDTTGFTSTVAGLDKSKPLFIASHLPLHDRRGDSNGAAAWYEAISAAAEEMDIVFFWAHNHTGENSVDQAAFYVAKDGDETITLENTNTVVTPNFTYMNAGFVGKSSERGGVVTTVKIYADALVFQDYTSSGAFTGEHSHNVEVEREFNTATETTPTVNTVTDTADNGDVVTAEGLGLTGVTLTYNENADTSAFQSGCAAYDVALEGYTEGETVTLTFDIGYMDATDLVVYADGVQITPVSVVDVVEDEEFYSVQVTLETTSANGTYIFGKLAADEDAVLEGIEITSLPTTTAYTLMDAVDGNLYLDITGLVVKAVYDNEQKIELEWDRFGEIEGGYSLTFDLSGTGEKEVTVAYGDYTATFSVTVYENAYTDAGEAVAEYVAEAVKEGYVARDIELTGYTDGENVRVVMEAPEGANVVYYVAEDGTLTEIEGATFENGVVAFTTDHFSTYVVGESTEITVPDPETATGSGETTTTTKKTVYVLTSSISSGNSYLIANSNSASSTTRYLLANNNGSVAATGVTIKSDDEIGTYIELDDAADELWTVSGSSSTTLKNGSYYLRYNSGLSLSTSSTTWSYSSNRLSYRSGSTTRYLRYSSGWTTTDRSSNATSIYFYVPTEIDVETTTTVSGTYSIEGEDLTIGVDSNKSAYLSSTLIFVPTSGTATTTNVSDSATYTVVAGGDPNGIISGIENDEVTFTGEYGKALVKVSYTTDFGEVTDYITITAVEAVYTLDLCEAVTTDGTTTYESITETIVIKGVDDLIAAGTNTYPLWAVITKDGEDMGSLTEEQLANLTFVSSNPAIATVDSATGIVTFVGGEGAVQITAYYEYADGKSVTDTVTFSVSKNSYVVPEDGTDDFPEYPNQGAIRIDKTAVAVGNFSQTGIAMVELSMTGVPYGTSTKTDVVIMVDMTASMSDDDVTAAELAVQELIKSLVYDEENDKYDPNIQLFVDVFYSASSDSAFSTKNYLNGTTISNASELTAAQNLISFSQSSQGGGTRYNKALENVYNTLNRDGHAENQFVVFVSDGVATAYSPLTNGAQGTTITGSNSETASLAAGWFDDEGEVTDEFETEYYTYLFKTAGIPVYTVGANLTALSDAADVLNHMSSNYSPDGKTSTGQTKYSFFCTTSGGITDEVLEIFRGIGQDIKEAATNVVVEDKIDSHYTMNVSLPAGVTSSEAGMDEFYIQVVGYELDDNHERKDNPTVLEKFLFNTDGTVTHTVGGNACGDTCSHATYTDGVLTALNGTYFSYTKTGDNEILTWTAEKLDRTELALQYFVYLDNSAGDVAAGEQVAAGTYPTNEYATITYTNHLGHECQQEFPVPSMTWKGAKVTYLFYLVNSAGQPVNRAGKVIPFAEAVYVTDPVTIDVTWNDIEGHENILAEDIFATAGVPDVYKLYDEDAAYVIRVYQTEDVDANGVNGNYFQIDGASDKLIDSDMDTDTTVDNSTTKVFNTKAGVKYDEYGVYSVYNVGTSLTDGTNSITTTVKATDIDYANTTVAFAVVWTPELVEDTVVVDFGLDVIIDVTTNDGMASGVVGVRTEAPSGVTMNSGTYDASNVKTVTSDDGLWTASVENLTSVRFHMNKMGINAPASFYYESDVNYYTYANNVATVNTTSMYSQVTVIPATTVYYEDDFVTFTSYTNNVLDEESQWVTTAQSGEQEQDRPGASKISAALDADNNYGYDAAYESMSTHSMGSAAQITVDAATRGEAVFTFYGTGFDVLALSSSATGSITVQVYQGAAATGTALKTSFVDTYYGMDADGNVSLNNPDALYQVPVIKISGLTYGQYTVKITAGYNTYFDHSPADGQYTLYLDAIRVYDPTQHEDAVDAYLKDGEAYPVYQELRNNIIAASSYSVDSEGNVSGNAINGVIFIDTVDGTAVIADYVSYGPNNELYLKAGQSIAFNVTMGTNVADVQLGIKVANGGTVNYSINGDSYTAKSATDLYYSILDYAKGGTVTITNTSGGILSLTNIKVTHTSAPTSTADLLWMDADSATFALMSLRAPVVDDAEPSVPETSEPAEPEVTEPETTEPETTEPETTEPETTEPEETEPEETKPETSEKVEELIEVVKKIVRKFFGRLFG